MLSHHATARAAGLVVGLLVFARLHSAAADPMRDCEQRQDAARAILACSKLIAIIPGSAALHNKRGIAYIRNGEINNAIFDYSEAIRIDPKGWEPY
jgi:Flp pilus assembly protein TadD